MMSLIDFIDLNKLNLSLYATLTSTPSFLHSFFIWNDLKKTDIKIQNNSEEEVEFTAKYYNKETLNDMK